MTAETTQTTPRLVRALKLRDLVLFNLVADVMYAVLDPRIRYA